jgi:hypothetical protein
MSDAVSQTLVTKKNTFGVRASKVIDQTMDIVEETFVKDVLSPKIQYIQNQTATTNKFSNFGFFAGSPRATTMAGVAGNIA